MSSDTFIVYFGLRFEVGADEIEGIELRSDKRIMAARRVGLKCYWGNFGALEERYLLFIGAEIAILGAENSEEVIMSFSDAQRSFDDTKERLKEAGFSEVPKLHFRWRPDV